MRVDYYGLLDQDRILPDLDALVQASGLAGAVYRVHAHKPGGALTWHPDNMTRIGRAVVDDPLGRLYIGAAQDCRARITAVRRSLAPASQDAHTVGLAFQHSEALRRRFPLLCFTLRFADDPFAAEAEEFAAYLAEFGEVPPLNAIGAHWAGTVAPIA